ncbi:hypothetical protein ACVDFE_35940 [Lentzea chajnantorensis]
MRERNRQWLCLGWSRHGWWLHDSPEPADGPPNKTKCSALFGCTQCQADRAGLGSSVTRDQMMRILQSLHAQQVLSISLTDHLFIAHEAIEGALADAGIELRD